MGAKGPVVGGMGGAQACVFRHSQLSLVCWQPEPQPLVSGVTSPL
jgi:hypothetical protein